jgi:hypothetical protein
VVVHIDRDLFTRLGMENRECAAHSDGPVSLTARSEKRSDYALLGICTTEMMVEDGEESGRVNGHGGCPTEMREICVRDEVEMAHYDKFRCTADNGGPSVIL